MSNVYKSVVSKLLHYYLTRYKTLAVSFWSSHFSLISVSISFAVDTILVAVANGEVGSRMVH